MNNETFIQDPNKAFYKAHATSLANDITWRECKHCGKLLSYKQMEEQTDVKFVFIPDTEFTVEEAYYIHKRCQ